MKKTNELVIIILFCSYIFFTGITTIINNSYTLENDIKIAYKDKKTKSKVKKFNNIKTIVENSFSNNINGKYMYIDIYGAAQKMMFKNVVSDAGDGKNVIYLSDGNLTFIYPKYDSSKIIEKLTTIKQYGDKNGIYVLFTLAPWKVSNNSQLPFYLSDHTNENKENFIKGLKNNNIPYINFEEELDGTTSDWFFKTDHHWNIQTAFSAYKKIMARLSNEQKAKINEEYLNNYEIVKYKNIFLGTYGKRTGIFYGGVDNYNLYLPKFDTDLEVSYKRNFNKVEVTKKGKFKDTLVYEDYVNVQEIDREMSTYYAYGEGTKAEVVIKNNAAQNKNNLLIIKDSFADPVYPLLALNFKETRVLDIRRCRKIDLFDYIKKNKIKIIVFIQSPGTLSDETIHDYRLKSQ